MEKLYLNDIERLIVDKRIELRGVKSKLASLDSFAESRYLTDAEKSERRILKNKRKELNENIRELNELKEDKKSKKNKTILFSGLGIVVVLLMINIYMNSLKSKGNISSVPTAVATTATPSAIPTATPTATPMQMLTLEDIYNNADYVYDKEFASIASRSNRSEEEIKRIIEDITVMFYLGEPTINDEYIGESTIREYLGYMTELYGNLGNPSTADKKLHSVNYSTNNLEIKSDEMESYKYDRMMAFLEKYDIIYGELYNALNSENNAKSDEKIIELTKMLHDDWVLGGLYSGIDPYNFAPEHRLIALNASISRYVPIFEYLKLHPLCTELCINPDTGKKELINVYSVIEAISSKSGKSSDGKIVLDSLPKIYDTGQKSLSKIFINDLLTAIEGKRINSKTLKLG